MCYDLFYNIYDCVTKGVEWFFGEPEYSPVPEYEPKDEVVEFSADDNGFCIIDMSDM